MGRDKMSKKIIISHNPVAPENQSYELKKEEILSNKLLEQSEKDELIFLLDELVKFPLGKFIFENKGLNGEWTDYAVFYYPMEGKFQEKDKTGRPFTRLERAFLEKFPYPLATQERAKIFGATIQSYVKDNITFASLPCGLMRELFRVDYGTSNFDLVGIDLDKETLKSAEALAQEYGLFKKTKFHCLDAWNLPFENSFDLLSSNGLNIYEPNNDRVIELYKQFNKSLKPGGIFVTSYLTPPPLLNPKSEWDMKVIDPVYLRKQQLLLVDIVGARCSCFRTTDETKAQLEKAGFKVIDIKYDNAKMFPTVVAEKVRL